MKAIILAAGQGRRLWPFTSRSPKCLLSVGPQSILQHQLANLEQAGVDEVVVVSGYGHRHLCRHLENHSGLPPVKLIYNPLYKIADNLVSLWMARYELDCNLVLINGDNVFHASIIDLLRQANVPCSVMVRRTKSYDEDDMKVHLAGERIRRIGKELPLDSADAESVGIMGFSPAGAAVLRQAVGDLMRQTKAFEHCFPAAIQEMADRDFPVIARDIGDRFWADIDTPTDLNWVRRTLVPACQGAPPPTPTYGGAREWH